MGGILSSLFDALGAILHLIIVGVIVFCTVIIIGGILFCIVGIPAILFYRRISSSKSTYGRAEANVSRGGSRNASQAVRVAKTERKEEKRADQRAALQTGLTLAEPETALLRR